LLKRTTTEVTLTLLFVSILFLTLQIKSTSSSLTCSESDVLINGDFETGTFDGWIKEGVCQIDSTVVHNGTYSAYISDAVYDSSICQDIYPRVRLPVDSELILEGWVYPTKVGNLGDVQYPHSAITLWFYNESSMKPEFVISYRWCTYQGGTNGSWWGGFLLYSWHAFEWNFLSRNVTADFYSLFGEKSYPNIVLQQILIVYHFSGDSPGAFYADALIISAELHDVAVLDVALSKTVVGEGYFMDINVTVENQGNYTETFALIIYANTTIIHTVSNTTLAVGNLTILTFKWRPLLIAKGNYTISAEVTLAVGERDTEDNMLTGGWVLVTFPGDVNGDFRCEGKDNAAVAKAYDTRPGDLKWNPNADINNDYRVEGKDNAVIAKYYDTP